MTDYIAERIKIDIAERIRRLPELANLPGGALGADCFEAAMEIEALRAENAALKDAVSHANKMQRATMDNFNSLHLQNARLREALKQIADTYNKPTTSKDGLAFLARAAIGDST